jgi:hypothetical protein
MFVMLPSIAIQLLFSCYPIAIQFRAVLEHLAEGDR